MRIRTVIRAVVTDFFDFPGILKVSVAHEVALMIHCKVAVRIIILRQSDLPVTAARKLVFADHSRAIGISAVIDNRRSVVAPHLMAYPVRGASRIPGRIPQGICPLSTDPAQCIRVAVIQPDAADSAVKTGPFVIVHDDLGIQRMELHMRDPALGDGFFI